MSAGKKKSLTATDILYHARRFIIFLLMTSFVVTCCALLLLRSMQIDEQAIRQNAPLTLFNVLFLSVLIWCADTLRRYFWVNRHVRRIVRGLQKIQSGDFSVRIAPVQEKNSRNELDGIIDGINQMTQELAGVETLRTDFISNVSHELKTPLAVIDNYATLLRNPALTHQERMDYARIISGAAARLSGLITNILKLSKLENQQIYPVAASYDLGEQLCECMLGFESIWEEKRLDIQTDIEDGVVIQADRELLGLVWNNLLSNAVKFTEPGGTVSCALHADGPYAVVSVSDTGCGMSPETGAHIFEKFYQGDTSHAAQGNGLGLALVKKVVDIVGGEISVASTLGKGSTFTVKVGRQTL
ncbi:MAG: HAMP domain-containing sensor histidine kinase [Clostridia bacterium]|nr:HAMP domain-containing sensor histidine kinase [Clostridia bacterium]